MRDELLRQWLYCHMLSVFFEDPVTWKGVYAQAAPALWGAGGLPAGLSADEDVYREYDELFCGTNANIYIPLWASACRGKGDVLLDATTLEVIRFYHRWGYQPVEMNGNPPDYIGQQLRFLAYLCACGLHCLDGGGGGGQAADDAVQAIRSFVTAYLQSTARAVVDGVRAHGAGPLIAAQADALEGVFSADAPGLDEAGREAAMALLQSSPWSGVYRKGRLPAIPDRAERVINTAGRNNCGGKCVIRATEQEGCVLRTGTDTDLGSPPLKACARGRAYRKTYLNGKRLRYPMKRVGERGEGRFQRITWAEAADIAAREWVRIRDTYGPGARYINYGSGVSAVLRPDHMAARLLNLDGGFLGKYNSYSSACSRYVGPYIYGDVYSGNGFEDLPNTKLLLLWGHNPVETIFGTQRNYYIAKAREAGAKVIVIDPRQSDTAVAFGDQWIGIRPSTDSALADAMAYVIWSEGLQDQHFMDTYCNGFDEQHMPKGIPAGESYHAYLFGRKDGIAKTPAWAAGITGIAEETIATLARTYARTKPACLLPGLGLQRTGNGEQTVRSLAMLACLTGNVGIPGGGAGGGGAVREHLNPVFPAMEPAFPGSIPSFLWTTAVENGPAMNRREHGLEGVDKLETGIKMILNLAGNILINQHADINNTARILGDTQKCEFIVCSDVFMTPSARFADLLLPATSFLEGENIVAPWEYGSYLLRNNPVVSPLFACRFEYDFLRDVAERIGLLDLWEDGRQGVSGWLESLYEEVRDQEGELPPYKEFCRRGGYQYRKRKPYIAYEDNIRDPDHHPFATPTGKIEIFSQRLYSMGNPEEIPAIPRYVACVEGPEDKAREQYPLQLIGWHTKRRCHSIHDHNDWMEALDPQRMWMHPEDAANRGIEDGAIAEVFNARGRLRIPVQLTHRIVQGVVAIAQGAWYTPDSEGVDTRGSINVLTSTRPTPLAKGNAQHTNLVQVVAGQ